jgi:hypothetical protein
MGGGKCIYDTAPYAGPPPADEAVVASCVGPNAAGRSRQGAPDRKTQKMPLRTRRSFTRGTPRDLFGSIGFMAAHSKSASRSLNHKRPAKRNAPGPAVVKANHGIPPSDECPNDSA